ncbi:hypothetical protein [Sulfitobacter sp.]|uniref:hypothetical protein n=1 Tax=Sulfitobacter sp. TaxID=1903071 RepID=UPI003565DF56
MTRFTALAAALLMTAGAASAQVTTATQVGGETGIAGYPVQVVGANGITYACSPLTGGTYNCINAANAAAAGFAGVGAGTAAGAGLAIVAVAALASGNDDETNGTNGTNGTN